MARAIWSGSISFGLVNIPVKLYTAVTQREVRFNMLHAKDGARINLKRFCSAEGVEVPSEEIVKGYELSRGRYVTVTSEELEAADPAATKAIAIEDFSELTQIDPVHFDATYYLGPDKGAERPYALLLETMRSTGKVGIARFVLRSRETLCCIRPVGEVLALSTMNWADEIVPAEELGLQPARPPEGRELDLARKLVESLTTPFEADRYRDTHREKVLELLKRKGEGEEVVAAPAPAMAQVVNLADALAASLAASQRTAPARAGGQADAGEEEAEEKPAARGARSAPRPRQAARTAGRRRRST